MLKLNEILNVTNAQFVSCNARFTKHLMGSFMVDTNHKDAMDELMELFGDWAVLEISADTRELVVEVGRSDDA